MGWQSTTLGEVTDIVSGATPKSSVSRYWDGENAWATPTDLSRLDGKHIANTERSITGDGLNECSARLLPKGSVLFSSRAPIGLVAINTIPMATNQGFKSFVPSNEVNADFLYWWLKANRRQLQDLGNGATFKEVSKGIVSKVAFPLPPISEQRRIAAILDKADAIRRKSEQAITLADDFLKSVFLEMFGDQVLNPKNYSEMRLDEIAEINSGITKGRKTKLEESLRSVPYMRVANVQDGYLALDEIKEIDATKTEIAKFLLRTGDILLTEGGDPDKLGRGCVWNEEIPESIHQNHIFRVRLTSNAISPLILQLQIGSQRGKQYFLRAAKQTTGIASINKRQLSAYPVLVPDAAHQSKYEKISAGFSPTVDKLKQSVQEADDLFNSLSQRAFAGEL
jgi:type I restriction enzyme S subunit